MMSIVRALLRCARPRGPGGAPCTRFRPQLEALDRRDVPATFYVTSGADSGPGTLRAALDANNTDLNKNTPNEIVITSGLTVNLTGPLYAYNSSSLVIRTSVPGAEAAITTPMMQPWLENTFRFLIAGFGNSGTYQLYDLDIRHFGTNGNGGAILHQGQSLEIHSCDFTDNTAAGNGGAIANEGLFLTIANYSYFGGQAMQLMTQSGGGNVAGNNGGAVWHFPGGGLHPLVVDHSDFGRRVWGAGGFETTMGGNMAGIDGGAIWSRTRGDTNITESHIMFNEAWRNGGGVYQELGDLNLVATSGTITTRWITDNTAHNSDGGGVFCNDSSAVYIDCLVGDNVGLGLDWQGNLVPGQTDDVTFDGIWWYWVNPDPYRIGFFDANRDQLDNDPLHKP